MSFHNCLPCFCEACISVCDVLAWQGVTKEDLEKAEQALQAADKGQVFPRSSALHSADNQRTSTTDDRSDKENSRPDQDTSSSAILRSTARGRHTPSSSDDKKEVGFINIYVGVGDSFFDGPLGKLSTAAIVDWT